MTKETRTVQSAVIGTMRPMPAGKFDPLPAVTVTWDDGETEKLFTFYPDEISFSEAELIGLTRGEIKTLYHRKDVSYLQS